MFTWFKKAKLTNAFRIADLSFTVKRGNNTYKRYPAIIDFRDTEEHTLYVFKLPTGVNPRDLKQKEFVFLQVFGKNYTLNGDGVTYSLKVYKKEIEKGFIYDYSELEPLLSSYSLPILAGKDIQSNILVYDMVNNPHLLIAGETGSGKSVTMRAILTTLILHKRDSIDFYLGDMKRSEFHLFRNIEGVQAVMTTKQDLHKCLMWLEKELRRRGDLLDGHEVEHIDEYNKLGKGKEKYILLAIDEVALLKKDKDLMDIIEAISCIGRALGVFLILSMQRPDSKVLEGQLKNNLTVRYAFKHSDKINSDITLGRGTRFDASLIGNDEKGKFLYKNQTTQLIQAPLLKLADARELLLKYKKTVIEREDFGEVIEQDFAELPIFEEGDS